MYPTTRFQALARVSCWPPDKTTRHHYLLCQAGCNHSDQIPAPSQPSLPLETKQSSTTLIKSRGSSFRKTWLRIRRHLSSVRALPSTLLMTAALLLSACGDKNKIPDLHGMAISRQDAVDLEFQLTERRWVGKWFVELEDLDATVILPRIHKWFTPGWGINPKSFNDGTKVSSVGSIPQYVIDDLSKVLVADYTPHVPMILTTQFWKDMKVLTENPLVPVFLAFESKTLDASVIKTTGQTLFLILPVLATQSTLIHEGTHIRQQMHQLLAPKSDKPIKSSLSEDCITSLTSQLHEVDAYDREYPDRSTFFDGIHQWYNSWSDLQLASFLETKIKNKSTGEYKPFQIPLPRIIGASYVRLDDDRLLSCPESLRNRVNQAAKDFLAKNYLPLSIELHNQDFFKAFNDDINAHHSNTESCLSTVRSSSIQNAEQFYQIPICQKRFGALRDMAQRATAKEITENINLFTIAYVESLREIHPLLVQTSAAYRRLTNLDDPDLDKKILQYLPKELFSEDN